MTAYYNEYDPFAAAWLGQLIADGLIAPGIVDTRSITDVQPSDLKGFTQWHFFAGLGVWSLAARIVGWPDDRPLISGSCPCPPFSSAGPTFRCPVCDTPSPVPNAVRTGAFNCVRCDHEWQADERHLFPEFYRLIRHLGNVPVVGEQVASRDGRTWIDIVRASLEMLGRTVGVVDTCAAGHGAPHIRQRIYWLADAADSDGWGRECGTETGTRSNGERRRGLAGSSDANRLVGDDQPGLEGYAGYGDDRNQSGRLDARSDRYAATPGVPSGLDDTDRSGTGTQPGDNRETGSETFRDVRADDRTALPLRAGSASGLADADRGRRDGQSDGDGSIDNGSPTGRIENDGSAEHGGTIYRYEQPGPTNGFWRDADWLFCRDGKWRPVEPGTFPLANAGAFRNRVAELRGAGNAVNVAQAAGFLRAVMACI